MTPSSSENPDADKLSAGAAEPVGDGDYTVKQGECLSSIAYEKGFFWQTLWKHPGNAKLRARRRDPKVLLPGDRVHIPELQVHWETCATEKRHRFIRKGVPEYLRIILLDADGKPRVSVPYTLIIDGKHESGMTDKNGMVESCIRPNAQEGTLIVGREIEEEHYQISLGSIDPPSTITGVQARLNNLGFPCGEVNGELGEQTIQALKEFQERHGLQITGEIDEETRSALLREHNF